LRGQTWNRSAARGRATRLSCASEYASSPTDSAGSPVPGRRQVSDWIRHSLTLGSSRIYRCPARMSG
jgi:hypothetical protein